MEQKVKWTVSLNNGETLYENKGLFTNVLGELSAWNKLQNYINENNLTITSLSLMTDAGQRWNLPSMGKNPKFKAFDTAVKPYKYVLERKVGVDWDDKDNLDTFTTISAYLKIEGNDYKQTIWVQDNNPQVTWVIVNQI
jgi:hypothetical protein